MTEPTLYAQLTAVADGTPERTFLVHGDRRWTWAEARKDIDALASGLLDLGVQRGDKVAIWLPNLPEWPLIWAAAASIGAAIVPVNTRYTAEEAAYVVGQSDSGVLFFAPHFHGIDFGKQVEQMTGVAVAPGELTSAALPALRHLVAVGDGSDATPYQQLLERPADEATRRSARSAVRADDDLILVYTSGTTGFPKGARHTHTTLPDIAAMANHMGITREDRILAHMPFFHVGGAFLSVMTALVTGCSLVCVDVFSGESALRTIEGERCTVVNGVPSHFVMMLSEIDNVRADLSSARVGWIAGAMIPPDVVRGIRRHLGINLLTMYGMTETTGVTTATRLDDPEDVLLNTVGRPIANDYEITIIDPDTMLPVPADTEGEIWVRGHRVTRGYYRVDDPDVFRADGWFRTGDLGVLRPDGRLVVTGRLKDMFIVGGTNTYPAEIENVIGRLDEVAQVHVVGIPDERLGEVGMAFVQLKTGHELSETTIVEHCRVHLANYKVPRRVQLVDDYPMTATGKIQKYRLRDQAIQSLGLAELSTRRLLDHRPPDRR